MRRLLALPLSLACFTVPAMPALIFTTGNPDGLLGAASRPGSAGVVEVESADDFVLTSPTLLTSATFTGLITGGGSI